MQNRVRELRIQKGVTQQKCADEVGISVRTLQRYEKGRFGNVDYLARLAAYLDASIDELKQSFVEKKK